MTAVQATGVPAAGGAAVHPNVDGASAAATSFLVCYDRVCCPTVKTDCHVAPPGGCRCNGTEFFCMKGHVV